MNYCTKCDSYYRKPGTCNCFAGAQPYVVPLNPYQGTFYPLRPQDTTIRPTPYTFPLTSYGMTAMDQSGNNVQWSYTEAN